MPFDVQCDGCGRKFRAPDKLVGKRVKCPQCQAVLLVGAAPGGAPGGKQPSAGAKKKVPVAKPVEQTAPAAPTEPEEWHMQTEDGQEYGPVTRSELKSWVTEGRLDSTCQVLKDGWDQWKWADEEFPQLAESSAPPPAPPAPPADNPFAGIGEAAAPTAPVAPAVSDAPVDANPFASPQTPYVPQASVAPGGEDSAITPRIRRALADTKPWVTFLAILGFILGGLGVLVTLFQLALALRIGSPLVIGIVVLMAIGPALYLVASYYLITYGSRIGDFLRNGAIRQLEDAMVAQKSFWKLIGIVTAIVLAVYFVAILLFFSMARAPMPMPMP